MTLDSTSSLPLYLGNHRAWRDEIVESLKLVAVEAGQVDVFMTGGFHGGYPQSSSIFVDGRTMTSGTAIK